eukprot:jgi/Pico_ML_1/51398/g205.t1
MQIHSTSQKLAKLAQLAKRTSMFDDPEREINELTTVIRQDITVLNGSLAELQGISVGQEGGSKSKQNVDHSATVVKNLQSKLMDTTKEFQNVLTLRKENSNGSNSSIAPTFEGSAHQQQALMPAQDTYLESRAEALHNVESTITELGGIFQQLAHLVKEQGEVAIRIDENMDDTLSNVDQAQGHLMKYLNRISSNRWLAIKILLVLLVFGLFFVLFVA